MKKLFLVFLLFFKITFSFSQNEKDEFDIYNKIIDFRLAQLDSKIDTIIVIKQFEDVQKQDFSLITDLTLDTIPDYAYNFIYSKTDKSFIERLRTEPEIKKVIADLISNFKNHPNLDRKLNHPNVYFQYLNSKTFDSYFKNAKKIDNSWKKIKKKYNSNLIFQFSRVQINSNLATLYQSHHCGGLCGSGDLFILEKINEKWEILKIINLWQS